MKKSKIVGIILLILGLVIALSPGIIAPVCPPMENGKFMKCHWMGQAIKGVGGVMILTSLVFIMVKDIRTTLGIAISNIGLGLLAFALPFILIGGCKSPTMSCNTHTKPLIYLVSGLFILINLIYILKNKYQK